MKTAWRCSWSNANIAALIRDVNENIRCPYMTAKDQTATPFTCQYFGTMWNCTLELSQERKLDAIVKSVHLQMILLFKNRGYSRCAINWTSFVAFCTVMRCGCMRACVTIYALFFIRYISSCYRNSCFDVLPS